MDITGITTPNHMVTILARCAAVAIESHPVLLESMDIKEKDINAAIDTLSRACFEYASVIGTLMLTSQYNTLNRETADLIEEKVVTGITLGLPLSYVRDGNKIDVTVNTHANSNMAEDLED